MSRSAATQRKRQPLEREHDSTWSGILKHVDSCPECRWAMVNQQKSFASTACTECWELLVSLTTPDSPVHHLHFSEDLIEANLLGRLNVLESRLFDIHKGSCNACAAKLHKESLLFYALKAALSKMSPETITR